MRRLLPAALVFLALGPLPGTAMRFPVPDLSQQANAHRLAMAPQAAGTMRFVRGWHLTSPNSRFGGFSGLAISAPGRFELVSDSGWSARFTLGASERLDDVHIAPLPRPKGHPRGKSSTDAESLFVDESSGTMWIGLEGINQIWRLRPDFSRYEGRRALPQRPAWPANSGPEALTRLADGRTLVFSESADQPRGGEALLYPGDPVADDRPPLHFFYDRQGKGAVSDAAALPDGRILLIHRKLGIAPVFTTTVALLDPADIRAGGVVRSTTIGHVPRALADNFEGATVTVAGGRTWLWLVSDDNYNNWQRSLLLQFELVDLPPRRPDSKKAAR